MNRSMRRKDRQMNQETANELLMRGEYGVLSSVDADGQPYGVPVNYVFDGKDSIYFHCAREGHKLDNLHTNPRVSFTIVGNHQIMDWKFSTAYESVIVFGVAEEVEGDEKYLGLKMLAQKFSPNYMHEFEKEIEKAMIPSAVVKSKSCK
ncbi:MAG: pyridoxamine 5'-phosphate oxidase family protein [Anaerolineaceae bacterium]|nr:pyridoxamine 5'-phosphate oxidase family protein [Anaerolineaceae bacterium]